LHNRNKCRNSHRCRD